jgi:hypothetical protein
MLCYMVLGVETACWWFSLTKKLVEWDFKTKKLQFTIHPFSILSDDRFKASSKTIPPHSAI